jgi:hypothetical protein
MRMDRAGYENGTVEMRVWVDAWQVQCCGEPFVVGDEVAWKLRDQDSEWLKDIIGADLAHGVDKAEEHHEGACEQARATVGIVDSIHAVHCRYAPLPGEVANHLFPVCRLRDGHGNPVRGRMDCRSGRPQVRRLRGAADGCPATGVAVAVWCPPHERERCRRPCNVVRYHDRASGCGGRRTLGDLFAVAAAPTPNLSRGARSVGTFAASP